MVTISFPGLGIGNFTVNKVAFTIPIFGGIEVRWYGIIITIGIILAFWYCTYRAKQENISFDDLLDMAIFTIIFSVIGARLYYVLTTLGEYDSFYDVIAIWEGGLAIYGAIIAGAITIYFVCRHKKIKVMKAYDMVCPAVMIGQILGRWGNFFNGEAHGTEIVEGSPLYFIRMGLQHEGWSKMYYYHPTFLYESVWNLIGFIIINALYKKKKFDGQVFLMYISWYGFGRMFIEGLRTDSLYVGIFRISQVVGFLCFVIGTAALVYNLIRARRVRITESGYTPTYPKFAHTDITTQDYDGEEYEEASEKDVTDKSGLRGEEPDDGDGPDIYGGAPVKEEKPLTEKEIEISEKLKKLFDDGSDAPENGSNSADMQDDAADKDENKKNEEKDS